MSIPGIFIWPFLLLAATSVLAADDKPVQPQNITHRITGLFSPNRETDLRAVLEQISDIKIVSIDFDHAEVTFAYDPALAFKGIKSDDLVKSFDAKLRSASRGTFGAQPLVALAKDKLVRIEIPIAVLDCQACCLAAYESVSKIDGVAQATASSRDCRITALIDPEKTNSAALKAALQKRNVTLKEP